MQCQQCTGSVELCADNAGCLCNVLMQCVIRWRWNEYFGGNRSGSVLFWSVSGQSIASVNITAGVCSRGRRGWLGGRTLARTRLVCIGHPRISLCGRRPPPPLGCSFAQLCTPCLPTSLLTTSPRPQTRPSHKACSGPRPVTCDGQFTAPKRLACTGAICKKRREAEVFFAFSFRLQLIQSFATTSACTSHMFHLPYAVESAPGASSTLNYRSDADDGHEATRTRVQTSWLGLKEKIIPLLMKCLRWDLDRPCVVAINTSPFAEEKNHAFP
ncbi:hypothetical protein DFH27DRAFT_19692 [Peziza echinospora]|nr:hypothetical protein DFH27DRAFT_19692 [Peziza echinospora]